jgi:hypothetical protein
MGFFMPSRALPRPPAVNKVGLYYIERLGFQLDFQGPDQDPYYGRVSRDGIGIVLKVILPDVLPRPNRTRHEWARWDAYIYTLDPDALFDEFRQRGVSFVTELSFIDEGLWGFEITDADGYVLAFAKVAHGQHDRPGRQSGPASHRDGGGEGMGDKS